MRKEILIYIEGEGGGEGANRHRRDGEFRQSWRAFLQPLADHAREKGVPFFRCVPGRGGSTTQEAFAKPLSDQAGALRILLIDSEKPVEDIAKPWEALGLKKPPGVEDAHTYLMVQCLETWLLADLDSVRRHYDATKKCFKSDAIPKWPDLEGADRKTLQAALEKATSGCVRPYRHADGNLLIAKVDRERLKRLPSVARLFEGLKSAIDDYVGL